MKRRLFVGLIMATAVLGGIACAELLSRSMIFRDCVGRSFGRGQLLAVVAGQGIYQADVDRARTESLEAAGIENYIANLPEQEVLKQLAADAFVRARAGSQKIPSAVWKHEQDLLHWQFKNEINWAAALRTSGLNPFSIWQILRENLRTRQWIERELAAKVNVSEAECRDFYNAHQENFFEPEQFRASHLFLAAPPETPSDIVAQKSAAIEVLALRLAGGEDFAELAAENSEDEATKLRGGDLDYFSATRMPPDFVAAAAKSRPGEVSSPIRTRLGFHILKLSDVRPARQRPFEEVRSEIASQIADGKRLAMIQGWVDESARATAKPR